jgi:hypothetical protein
LVSAKPGDVAEKLLKETGNFANVETFTQNNAQGTKVTFHTHGVRVNGNAQQHGGKPQQVMIEVPESHRGMRLAHVELTHSQSLSEKTSQWSGKKDQNDTTAPYSQIEFHVEGKGWTTLGQARKFAEARSEVERLHDLPKAGGNIDAIRIKNVGVDPVHVQSLALHFLPAKKPDKFEEMIFTSGTSFGDPWNSQSPHSDRRREQNVSGGTRYPGGVTLNNSGDWANTSDATLDKVKAKGWTVDHSTLSIPLEPGKRFRIAEVAIGDTHPDNKLNNDKSYGYKGYATLTIAIERKDGKTIPLTQGENVPPQGVLMGGGDYVAQAGDKLKISVGSDTAALMGVRIGYDNT